MFRKICSILTPQASGHIFSNTSRRPEAASGRFSDATRLSGLYPIGLSGIGDVEKNHIAFAMLGNTRHDALDEVAVRVDEHEPLARFDVGEDEPFEQGRFSRARLPDDVHVREPIRLLYAENPPLIADVGPGEMRDAAGVAIHAAHFRPG